MSHFPRTRFGDIVAEFVAPAKRSDKVVIFCPGAPGIPRNGDLGRFFARKGYWYFAPRYRGSWESGGKFLKYSPEKDVRDVMDGLSRRWRSAWDGRKYKIKPSAIYLASSSFGGPAAILTSRDPRVKGVIAISPVVDWRARSRTESIDRMERFIKEAFYEAYRFTHKDWAKLKTGKFYNPVAHAREIEGKKIFMVHAKDDRVVSFGPVKKFAKQTGAALVILPRGGHLSSSLIMRPAIWKKIRKFLKGRERA
jgi:esterase/lipase